MESDKALGSGTGDLYTADTRDREAIRESKNLPRLYYEPTELSMKKSLIFSSKLRINSKLNVAVINSIENQNMFKIFTIFIPNFD